MTQRLLTLSEKERYLECFIYRQEKDFKVKLSLHPVELKRIFLPVNFLGILSFELNSFRKSIVK